MRRRRQCLVCDRRFTTYERVEDTIRLTVVKKDGSREPYQREKLITGLERACYKRPISSDQIRQIVESAEERIYKDFDKEIPSSFIGDTLGRLLREIDKIAYVRYASVYREFTDVGDLINEALEVKQDPVGSPEQQDLFD